MEDFRLPAVSYESLIKIIEAYNTKKGKNELDNISEMSGVSKDTIRRNKYFLVSVGIITKDGTITELGENLSRAYEYTIKEEIIEYWSKIIDNTDILSNIISKMRITLKTYSLDDFKKLILHDTKANQKNPFDNCGAMTIIEIFKICNLIIVKDDSISYNKTYDNRNKIYTEKLKLKEKVEELEELEENVDLNDPDSNIFLEQIKKEILDSDSEIKNFELALEFQSKATVLKKEAQDNYKSFRRMIILDAIIIIILFLINCFIFNIDKVNIIIKTSILSFAILGILFWFTKYFNRRYHENIQLLEDYEHKAITLLIFPIYSKELSRLDTADKKLLLDYVSKVSTTINKSPAIYLNKRKADNSPVEDIKDILLQLGSLANLRK